MIKRDLFEEVLSLVSEPRSFIISISGPRQVGKTTLINQVLKETTIPSVYISADGISQSNTFWISQQWQTARLRLANSSEEEIILVIDEIQKIENWSEIVKMEWDADSLNGVGLKLVVLGSSRLHIQKGLSESLAGRFEEIYMPHWSYAEMEKAFDFSLEHYLWFGAYPGGAKLINDEKRWKNYIINSLIETTLSKDILMMARIDKPALLHRVFELGCIYSGQILSLSKMLGQLQEGGNTSTLANYLNLLDSAGMLAGLGKCYADKIRTRSSSPKLQVYNTGLMNALRPEFFKQAYMDPALWGRITESAIGAHLLNYSRIEAYHLEYWRDRNEEVDFVLRKGDKIIGLEVKSNVIPKTKGMYLFAKKFNSAKVLMVGDSGIPTKEFLKMNPAMLFD